MALVFAGQQLTGTSRRGCSWPPGLRIRSSAASGSLGRIGCGRLLTRLAFPYRFHPHDSEEGRQLLAEAGQDGSRLPVVVFRTGRVLVDPSHAELAELLGASTRPQAGRYDLAIVGAGPAGLAAAVSAASEGLGTLVVEPEVFGGQAGTSSLIRNYPGFPHGISGDDLAIRTFEQAWLFGANFVFAQAVSGLAGRGAERRLRLADGSEVAARAVLLAPGVAWRRLGVPSLEALAGAGVFYGAAGSEAQAMQGQEVFVVGGGNSAGQAAVHLAEHAATVTMLVRGHALGATMSDYLVQKIEATPNIAVRLRTEVVDGHGRRAGGITLRTATGASPRPWPRPFVLIGAEPRTEWLLDAVACDQRGYVLTGGTSWSPAGRRPGGRPLARRCSWRRACPGCSPPGTSATDRSSGWPRPPGPSPLLHPPTTTLGGCIVCSATGQQLGRQRVQVDLLAEAGR